MRKAQTIRRAALAPAEPSPQDRRVATEASRMESKAQREISQQRLEEMQGGREMEGIERRSDTGASGSETAPAGPDLPQTGGSGKFVSDTSGDAGALFDLLA
jgi:hypothetical protein